MARARKAAGRATDRFLTLGYTVNQVVEMGQRGTIDAAMMADLRDALGRAGIIDSTAPLKLADVRLVHRTDPESTMPFFCEGTDLPGYIEIVREGLGARPEDAEVILDGIAEILADLGAVESIGGAALSALARFQRHALAIRDHLNRSADGWTVEPRKAGT